MHIRPLLSLIFATTTLVCTSLALGEESPDPEDLHIETVERGAESVEDPRFASGFVSRLSVEHLFGRGRNLGQALSLVPGLYVRRQSSFGQPAFVSLRGGNPRQLVVLFDGMRISVPAGLGFDVGQL
ncbi:MAG: TonB-dependent receptor, partial [Bradymonadaceae bacterium]